MTAALNLIRDAAVTCGWLDPEEPLSDPQAQFILRRFQNLVDSWANERLNIYETYTDTLPLVGGTQSYSTSLLARGRPMAVVDMYVNIGSNVSCTVQMISIEQWNAIGYKPTTGIPSMCFVDTSFPDTTLKFYPIPDQAYVAFISAQGLLLPAAMILTTDVVLPPGYNKMIVDGLAVDISAPFGLTPLPSLVESARQAKTVIKRNNYTPQYMTCNVPVGAGTGEFNIYSGANVGSRP